MAEILIKAVDATHADPEKDQRGCYKRGMPVDAFPDGRFVMEGANPNSMVLRPTFVWLLLPGIDVDRVRQFLAPEQEDLGETVHGLPALTSVRRRAWKLFVDELPASALQKFATQGYVTIGSAGDYTWSQVRNYIRRIKDNSLAPTTL